jgi:hypothetical protein
MAGLARNFDVLAKNFKGMSLVYHDGCKSAFDQAAEEGKLVNLISYKICIL